MKDWLMECERVGSKLAYSEQIGAKEWRSHIENGKQYLGQIKIFLPESKDRIEKMSEELRQVLEIISKREKSINSSMNELVSPPKTQFICRFIGHRLPEAK